MVSYATIRTAYNDVYAEMRKYIWGFPAVEALADVEVASYETCVDLDNLRSLFYRLRQHTREVEFEDTDLKKALDAFQEIIDNDNEVFVKLNKVNEVVPG